MTVEPGFGGQGFIPECMDKIKAVRAEIQKHGYQCELEIDGGAKLTNTADIVAAGADVIVAGSAATSRTTSRSSTRCLRKAQPRRSGRSERKITEKACRITKSARFFLFLLTNREQWVILKIVFLTHY